MAYPGGKAGAGIAERIICLMPPHRVYIEPFLGDAAVMRRKRWAELTIGLDVDRESPGLAWLENLGPLVASDEGGRRSTAETAIPPDASPGVACRSASSGPVVQAIASDACDFLEAYRFVGDELVYCDPPYLMSTRSGRRMYRHEFSVDQHRRLLRVAIAMRCRVMISGYWSAMYGEALAGWNALHYQAMTRGGAARTEHLWFNFPEPLELHDYRYLGAGFRDRERIRRKQRRWVAKLSGMPRLERQALLWALSSVGANLR